ncbi:hypothetical protein VTH8203_01987 [Vibrio thalassae]|uniref:DDE domain-containing protein n=1 Tax=Vibrio thalassae TaxID=1243014 RepID=A0A240EJK8_9VIBR|nr:hypothetical protein VTH8203_01987 [Vibrio thalassae]
MDETYIKVKGGWIYYYRAFDKFGEVIDYDLSYNRDETAAKAFLDKAIAQHSLPDKMVIDGSKSNYAAIDAMNVQLWLTGFFMLSLIEILNVKNRRRCRLSGLRPKTKRLNRLGCFTGIVYPIGHVSE